MPHFCGGNRQAPSRHRRAYRVTRCHPAPADPEPRSAVRHQPDDVPGCKVAVVPWHVIDVCVMAIMLSSMRTTTCQPIRLSRHLMRNGAEQWYWLRGAWWHGARPVWGTPYYSGDDYSSSSVETLRRSGAQGFEGGKQDGLGHEEETSRFKPAYFLP